MGSFKTRYEKENATIDSSTKSAGGAFKNRYIKEQEEINNIPNRVNSWFDKSNSLFDTNNTRYSDNSKYRTPDDTESYINDVTAQKDSLVEEATAIKNELWNNADKYNSDWLNAVIKGIDDNISGQSQAQDAAYKDKEYWAKWTDENAYNNDVAANAEKVRRDSLDLGTVNSEYENITNEYETLGQQLTEDIMKRDLTKTDNGRDKEAQAVVDDLNEKIQELDPKVKELKAKRDSYKQYLDDRGLQEKYDYVEDQEDYSTVIQNVDINSKDENYNNVNEKRITEEVCKQMGWSSDGLISLEPIGDSKHYDMMTEDEVNRYNYLHTIEGKKSADSYLSDLGDILTKRYSDKTTQKWAETTKDHPVLSSVAAAVLDVFSSASGITEDITNTLTGKDINVYSDSHLGSRVADTIKSNVSQQIMDSTDNKALGKTAVFLYNTGMSVAESLAGAATLGEGYVYLMGMNAASSESRRIVENGGTQSQAILGGLAAGAAESFFEKFSLDRFLSTAKPKGIQQAVKSVLAQSAVEGSEEIGTEISNIITNSIIMSKNSDYNVSVNNYESQGMTEAEAKKQAFWDNVVNVVMAGVGGAAAGLVMGGAGITLATVKDNANIKAENNAKVAELGDYIKTNSNVSTLAGFAVTLDSSDAQNLGNSVINTKNTDNVSSKEVGQLQKAVVSAVQEKFSSATTKEELTSAYDEMAAKVQDDSVLSTMVDSAYTTAYKNIESTTNNQSDINEEVTNNGSVNQNANSAAQVGNGDMQNTEITGGTTNSATIDYTTPAKTNIKSVSAKTVDTGEDVTIKGVESINGGNVKVTLDNGKTENIDNIDITDNAYNSLYSGVSQYLTTDTANAYIRGYEDNQGLSANIYKKGFYEYYRAGVTGVNLSSVKSMYGSMLNDTTKSLAYSLGRTDSVMKATTTEKQKAAEKHSAEIRKTENATANKVGGVVREYNESKLNNFQRSQLRVLDIYGKSKGIKIHVVDDIKTEVKDKSGKTLKVNGKYVKGDNAVVISLKADENLYLKTAGHEIFHFAEEFAPEETKALQDFVIDRLKNDADYDFKGQVNRYQKLYNTTDTGIIYSEMAADSCFEVLSNDATWDRLVKQDQTLANKVLTWFKQFITDLRSYIKKQFGNSTGPLATALNKDIDALNAIAEMWNDAVDKANDNIRIQDTAETNSKESRDKYSLIESKPITPSSDKWDRGATYEEAKQLHPTLFELDADNNEKRNPTQIRGTVSTYTKIYSALLREGFKGNILDASSGLGYGTQVGKDMGLDVDDVEPFPDANYKPKYTDYSKINNKYDVIISNAVLNVLPQDLRDDAVYTMATLLNNGGKMYVNVRGTDVKTNNSNIPIDENNMEYFVSSTGSYQKGFTKPELVSYLQDALGNNYSVATTGLFGNVAAIVTNNTTTNINPTENPDMRYSLSETTPDEIKKVSKENEHLKGVIQNLKNEFKLTEGVKLNENSIKSLAKDILSEYSSKYGVNELTQNLTNCFEYIANNNAEELSGTDIMATMTDIAKTVISQSETVDKSSYEEYTDLRKNIRNTVIHVTDNMAKELAYKYDSYENFRKSNFGKLKLSRTSGIQLDSYYNELSDMYPELFNADTHELDQIETLAKVYDDTKEVYIYNPYKDNPNEGLSVDSASYELAAKIYEKYFDIPEVMSFADKKYTELVKAKTKAGMKLSELKKEQNVKTQSLINQFRNKEQELREKHSQKEQETRQKYRDSMAKRIEERQKTELRGNIKNIVKNFSGKLINESDKNHIPEEMKVPILRVLRMLDFSTIRTTAELQASFDKLQIAYKKLSDDSENGLKDSMMGGFYDADIDNEIEDISSIVGNKRIDNLSKSELTRIKNLLDVFNTIVNNTNKTFAMNQKKAISDLGVESISGLSDLKKYQQLAITKGKNNPLKYLDELLTKGMITPYYFFKQMDNTPLWSLFNNLYDGENTYTISRDKAEKYAKRIFEKYNFYDWNIKEKHSTKLSNGDTIDLTLNEMMSLYATYKREVLTDSHHLEKGGFFLKNDDKNMEATPFKTQDYEKLSETLTTEQKKFVDDMVEYLSTVCADLGNEVSMKLFGIKKYKESYYFPFSVNSGSIQSNPGESRDIQAKNKSFTKKRVTKASAPLNIGDFVTEWSKHAEDMAMHNAFVLPLEDIKRVWNYKSSPNTTVKFSIKRAFGDKGNSYIYNFLNDLNGGTIVPVGEGWFDFAISRMKKVAVMANLSVAIQQPTTIARALSKIDAKYLIPKNVEQINFNKQYEEAKKYAPVYTIKEWGYFDTNMSKGLEKRLLQKDYEGIEKVKGFFTDSEYRSDAYGWLAQKGDSVAWGQLWLAAKNETKALHPNIEEGSQEFYDIASKRVTDIIRATQVYDSVFKRSEIMRSKGAAMKMATAFMAEPTTNYNMLLDAYNTAKEGGAANLSKAGKIIGSIAASSILNILIKSLIYAMRDREDEKKDKDGNIIGERSYMDKYIDSVLSNAVDEPVTLLPFVKDIISVFEGKSVTRTDLQMFLNVYYAIQKLNNDKYTTLEKIDAVVGAVAGVFGEPIGNISRDIQSIYYTFAGNKTTDDTASFNYYNLYKYTANGDKSKYTTLYNQLVNSGKSKTVIETGFRKALKNNDERIAEAAKARKEGDSATYQRIVKEVVADGFKQDTVVGAVNSAINDLKKLETTETEETTKAETDTETESSVYAYSDIIVNLHNNDTAEAQTVINDIYTNKYNGYIKSGKTKKEANTTAKSSIKSAITSEYKEIYHKADNKEKLRIMSMLKSIRVDGVKIYSAEDFINWKKEK